MLTAIPGDRNNYPQLSQPGAMSAIVVGHSVYLSSSLTGGGSLLYIPNANPSNPRLKYVPGVLNQLNDDGILEWALMACEVRSTNSAGHRSGGNCGEPLAALSFVQTDPTGVLDGAKVVTWGRYRDRTNGNAWTTRVMDPCMQGAGLGFTNTWGCAQLTGPNGLNMIVIPAGTQSVNTAITYQPTRSYPCYS